MTPIHNDIARRDCATILKAEIVSPTVLPWFFPVINVTKKHGKPRFCKDYRVLTGRVNADRFSLSKIQTIFDELFRKKNVTNPDFLPGYWEVRMSEESKETTAFLRRLRTFHFKVMPFGLMDAQLTFARMMGRLLGHLRFGKTYIDDAAIFCDSLQSHKTHLEKLFSAASQHGLKMRASTCDFKEPEVVLRG